MQLTSCYSCATIRRNNNRAPLPRRARHKSGGDFFYDSLNPTRRLAGRRHFPGNLGQLPRTVRLLLFGFYATQIAAVFFPASSEFASLMMTFAVFGAGFLMRPLGAIVLGAYIDDVGRRKGLIVTLSIMASGTILIVLVPGYESIGLFAPALVLIGRLLQGFSAGAELGGVSVYLSEIATPGRKGFSPPGSRPVNRWRSSSRRRWATR